MRKRLIAIGIVVFSIPIAAVVLTLVERQTESQSTPTPAAAVPESAESLLTVPTGKFTPAQVERARHDIEFQKSITTWEESSTGAYITFRDGNYNPGPIQLYRRADIVVIGDQASTGKIRYLTFYDPTKKKVATFSPAFGLKLVE